MNMLEAKGLCMKFRRRPVLDGLDLQLASGQVTVLLGANGAGKSTLMRLALGVLNHRLGHWRSAA